MHRLRPCRAAIAAALILAAPVIPAPLAAQETPRAAGVQTMLVGRYRVVALSDGLQTMPFDRTLVRTTPAHVRERLAQDLLPPTVPLSTNAYLIEGEGRRILVDTGAGAFIDGGTGHLVGALAAAGYRPADVTDIVLTHFHFDHAGGLVRNGAIIFPNATLHVARAEADHWFDAAKRRAAAENQQPTFAAVPGMIGPYRAAGTMRARDDGDRLAPGVTMVVRAGHTPGSTVVRLESEGRTMLFMGDLLHSETVQFAEPDIAFAFDEEKDAAVASRRATLAEAAANGWWLAFAHVSFPGIGRIRKAGDGYRWVPRQYGVDATR